MKILVINCGSSSVKYQLIDMETESVLAKGNYEKIGKEDSFLTHKVNNEKFKFDVVAKVHSEAIKLIMEQLIDKEHGVIKSLDEIDAIGHRIAHGGEKFTTTALVDDSVIAGIKDAVKFAPLHNPAHLEGIYACQKQLPGKPNVVVFDTAFHQTMPEEHFIYPIPYEYYKKHGIRKYGAHGTSHKYVAERVAQLLGKDVTSLKIITCHVGQGASLCAVKDGKCWDTSMGLTPLGGIAMGTRSGDLDPSVVTYLMEKENLSPKEMESILNKEAGLLGMSKISSDNRDIIEAANRGDERAQKAIKTYCYIIAQYIAKYAASMNGVDVIAFAGGVGERGIDERKEICSYLGFMGVELDEDANNIKAEEKEISTTSSKVKVWVVPTEEELMIARETVNILNNVH